MLRNTTYMRRYERTTMGTSVLADALSSSSSDTPVEYATLSPLLLASPPSAANSRK